MKISCLPVSLFDEICSGSMSVVQWAREAKAIGFDGFDISSMFIRNLPKELMDAFRATLEELESADLLVHVADASHPDLLQQITSVETILEELELQHMPRILLLNKWDLLDVPARAELADAFPHAIPVSARTGDGLKRLLEVLENMLLSTQQSQLLIPFEEDGPVLQ